MRRWLAALGLLAAPTAAAAYTSAWIAPFDAFSSRDWRCFDEINPFAFAFDARNEPFVAYPELLAESVKAKPPRAPLIPVLVNDVWSSTGKDVQTLKSAALLQYWLSDPARLERHAQALAALARPYDGIELDYEHVSGYLWPRYVELVSRVAALLHSEGKQVIVDLEPGPLYSRGGAAAKYWPMLGAVADRVKVMCYYERGELSDRPGPGSSAAWVEQTAKRILAVLPREKTALAFSLAATDWQVPLPLIPLRRHVHRIHYKAALALRQETKAEPVWDEAFQAPYFRYEKDGLRHEVWYEDERTLGRKLEIARKLGLGASFWYIGATRPDLGAIGICRLGKGRTPLADNYP